MPPPPPGSRLATSGSRTKWEAFWQAAQAPAEATHRRSVELALALLRPDGYPARRFEVLDLGCGGGRVIELLRAAGCGVVGLDLAAGALEAAQRRLGPEAGLIQGDAFHLGLAAGSFDVVLSLGYASVGSYAGVQHELARVLRPGGVALIDFRRIGLYHLPLLPWRGRRLLAAWRRGEVSLPLVGLRPAPTWAAAGLQLEAVRLFNTYPPLGPRLPRPPAWPSNTASAVHWPRSWPARRWRSSGRWDDIPVDDLVRELIQTGRTATNDEIQQILERLATAPLDTHLVRVPGYLRGQTYAGRMLRDRDESSIVHLVKRVRHDRQWAEGTTEADFLDDLHGVARQADARLLVYGRHGQHHACVFAETARVLPPSRRGEQALPNLLVVYLSERSVLRTGYQFSDLAALRIPGDARWLK